MRFVVHARVTDAGEREYAVRDGKLNDVPYAVFGDVGLADEWARYLELAFPHGAPFSKAEMERLLARYERPPMVVRNASTGEVPAAMATPRRAWSRSLRKKLERRIERLIDDAARGQTWDADVYVGVILELVDEELEKARA